MDAKQRLIPESHIPAYELMRDELVCDIHAKAKPINQALADFRMETIERIDSFMEIAFQGYNRNCLLYTSPSPRDS